MGLSRAAQIVTDAMDIKAFSKYKHSIAPVQGWYKSNRFAEAFSDSDSSESEEEEEEEEEEEGEENVIVIPCAV
jgi:hypothetical protein